MKTVGWLLEYLALCRILMHQRGIVFSLEPVSNGVGRIEQKKKVSLAFMGEFGSGLLIGSNVGVVVVVCCCLT